MARCVARSRRLSLGLSPLSFHLAGRGILMVFGLAFAVLVAPVPLFAQVWLVMAAVPGALLWKASSSYQG